MTVRVIRILGLSMVKNVTADQHLLLVVLKLPIKPTATSNVLETARNIVGLATV